MESKKHKSLLDCIEDCESETDMDSLEWLPSWLCPGCEQQGRYERWHEAYYCEKCEWLYSQGYTDHDEYKNVKLKYYSPIEFCADKWIDSICDLTYTLDTELID